MTMIEKMAKGMFDATMERRYADLPHNIPVWPPMREIEQEWLGHAKAALTAMLKPSEAMIEAGWRAKGDDIDGRPVWKCRVDTVAEYQFKSMIQAALDEPKTPPS